jgi:hypothetical protein
MYWIVEHLLLATVLTIIVALCAVLVIFLLLPIFYRHETRPQFPSFAASLVITILFSVVLANWYALKRDRDNRIRSLRDQHFAQLRSIIRNEAAKLHGLVDQIAKEGHITAVTKYQNITTDPNVELWPDVMSQDLANHWPDYEGSKRDLLSEIQSHDQEFRTAIGLAEGQIKQTARVNSYWKEVAGMSYVEQCLGHGDGIRLNVTDGGFSFSYWGGSMSNAGSSQYPPRPAPDQVGAFQGFQSIRPDPTLTFSCTHLRSHADSIRDSAEGLSRTALLLSQGTVLKGTCDFIKSGSLSD